MRKRAGHDLTSLGVLWLFMMLSMVTVRAQTHQRPPDVDLQWGVKIPMRDGVRLNATLFQPHAQKESLPVIMQLTPYISDSYERQATYFARHGYVYAIVDSRGRGNSEGTFEPWVNEARDGYDTVEWLAKQTWSNGKVAMDGASYTGFDQWSTLKESPPHLATIVPTAAGYPGVDAPFPYGIVWLYDIQWLTFTSGVTANLFLFADSGFWNSKWNELYFNHRPLEDLDRIVGNPSPIFQKWLQHPVPDAYWDATVPSPDQYRRVKVPILTITGNYDGFQPGSLTYYKEHMEYGNEAAKQNHYLVIGPWDHTGTGFPAPEVGGLKFGAASLVDINALHQQWYDWVMKDGPKPLFLQDRVAYYEAGAEKWKYTGSLDRISTETKALFLDSDGVANDVFHSGRLIGNPGATAAQDRWTYDPLDTRLAEVEGPDEEPAYFSLQLTTQRAALNLFGNGLVYHSEPFEKEAEITGFPKLTIWLTMDVPDTDLEANLYAILPNGQSILLTSEVMRARYRESLREQKLVEAGRIEKYQFKHFLFFSRQIGKGSRLRLVIRCPNSPGWEKNYNSGGIVAKESGKDARTAHIALHHDQGHQSVLELPIVK